MAGLAPGLYLPNLPTITPRERRTFDKWRMNTSSTLRAYREHDRQWRQRTATAAQLPGFLQLANVAYPGPPATVILPPNWTPGPPASFRLRPPKDPTDAMLDRIRDIAKRVWDHRKDHEIEFIKIIGHGGQGIAALFKGPPPLNKYYVVKTSISTSQQARNTLAAEAAKQREYLGLVHIVPALKLYRAHRQPAYGMQRKMYSLRRPRPGRSPIEESQAFAPDPTCILEYYPRGSLMKWIREVGSSISNAIPPPANDLAAHAMAIPERDLWRIFDCLVKGCIGLEFPPTPAEVEDFTGKNVSERMPRLRWKTSSGVHLDLDPSNVLIGDFDEGTHGDIHAVTPALKINDFGLYEEMADNINNRELYGFWSTRECGKDKYLTPEQFTDEWDYCRNYPDPGAGFSVAGNYGPHTNIWGIGATMSDCITLRYPSYPVAEFMTVAGFAGQVATYGGHLLNCTAVIRGNGAPINQRFPAVVHWSQYSQTLRELVARCLCHDPLHRPDLKTLQRLVTEGLLAQGPTRALNRADRRRVDQLIARPPPEPTRLPTELADWVNRKTPHDNMNPPLH
ncbi:kinase-like domain-containing protein [Echria macrotheca]|uniref:Kinase-like domain-containing protein n=1 Tax=Echria macrotheca TaxID=438768 RepID=A0AAJ0F7P0_9PEZI|nr:kinase-like domain-containing protein [Echria macrotheca]